MTNSLAFNPDLPNLGASAVHAAGAFALVLAIFFGGVWLFRNGQKLKWRKLGSPRLAIIEARSLGNRYALFLVGCDQTRLLIGSSPAGLTLLTQLPSEAPPEPSPQAAPAADALPKSSPFTACLQKVLRGSAAAPVNGKNSHRGG
jgi:flagellar biogenesis protein FliO